jgi:hypothetical protein
MKFNRFLVAILFIVAIAACASAQTNGIIQKGRRHNPTTTGTPANPQALAALQGDLAAAIQAMEAALPIYDGNRVRSIHAAHHALAVVDKSINLNAAARPASKAKDHIASGTAHSHYKNESITQSQTNMRNGLASLTTAQRDLQAAAGSTPNKHALEVQKLLTKAVAEANTAISLHSSQG